MAATTAPDGEPAGISVAPHALKRNALGAGAIAFLVIAMAAPLATAMGNFALSMALGNGIGLPGTFLLITLVLLVFSVGFAAMATRVVNTGAFYAYVGEAFGYRMGAAAGYIATAGYNVLSGFGFGVAGFFVTEVLAVRVGIDLPWWVGSMVLLAIAFVLAYGGAELSTRVTGTLLVLECAFLLAADVGILASQGLSAFSPQVFDPGNVFTDGFGIAVALVFLSFIGFEATAIFSEEAKDPRRTVGRATRIALGIIGTLYVLSSWALISNFGLTKASEIAAGPDSSSMFMNAVGDSLGTVGDTAFSVLIVTSFVALTNTVHVTGARYVYAMSRARLLPSALATVDGKSRAPVRAQVTQALFVLSIVVIWAILGLDPFLELGVLGTLGSVSIITLQTFAAFAILAFFRRQRDPRIWQTAIAPAVAGVLMLGILVAAVMAWPTLIGYSSGPMLVVPVLIPVLGVLGWLVAHRRGPLADEFSTAAGQADGW